MRTKFFKQIEQDVSFSADPQREKGRRSRYIVNKSKYRTVLVRNIPFLFTCDKYDKLQYLVNHSIVIKDDVIADVIPSSKIKKRDFDLVYDAGKRGGAVVMPGLINAHAHPPMYLLRSSMDLDEGESIHETLANLPLWEREMTQRDFALGAIGDLTEQQKFGATTTFSHYNFFHPVECASRLTKHNVINGISVATHVSTKNSPELIEKLLAENKNSHSKLAMTVHYLHKAKPSVLKKISAIIKRNNLLFSCHMAESREVVEETLKKYGMAEVDILEKYNLLNNNTLVSHAIHVKEKDIKRLVEAKVGIAHLPTSNRIHKSGTFPFWDYHEAGGFKTIALGTDSVISKSRLDILTEAYRARTTHLYVRTIKFGSLFKMMTVNGARVLHMNDRGRIAPGFKADLVFWKLKDRSFIPYDKHNPFTLLGNITTHSGRTVRDLMINGKFVIKNRKHQLVDESKLLNVLQNRHMRMRRRVEEGRE
ncbi:MAG: amidohydrolase family protein [Patescibacteria group bacterium]|nr:amidohydrolase family protein [Patescibacteria group bacterium]